MPWIENVSFGDIPRGRHHNAGENSMLIQIVDPDMEFPVPMHTFKETHQFKFLDLETYDDAAEELKVSDAQAEQLVDLLKHALDKRMNVVVHCVAGVCRSGAVCEVGVMMGFNDCEVFRSPNLMVKHKMMRRLGWTYDEQEPHTINGITLDSGLIVPAKEVEWTNDNEKVFVLAKERKERREQNGE
jgi:rhodanese-related sulfurtransferase